MDLNLCATASAGTVAYPAAKGKTILGRPWGPLAGALYHNCYMDDHISKVVCVSQTKVFLFGCKISLH